MNAEKQRSYILSSLAAGFLVSLVTDSHHTMLLKLLAERAPLPYEEVITVLKTIIEAQ